MFYDTWLLSDDLTYRLIISDALISYSPHRAAHIPPFAKTSGSKNFGNLCFCSFPPLSFHRFLPHLFPSHPIMPPAFYTPKLATCLCRQFRRPLRNFRILPAYRCFNSSIRQPSEVKEKESGEMCVETESGLLIIRTPRPPKLRHEGLRIVDDPAEEETLEITVDKLLESELMDAQSIDIALARPAPNVKVSCERYDQLVQHLSKSFVRPQLLEYCNTKDTEEAPPKLGYAATKREIIDTILGAKWGVAVSYDISERLDVIVNREFLVTRRDIFFILGKGLFLFSISHRPLA